MVLCVPPQPDSTTAVSAMRTTPSIARKCRALEGTPSMVAAQDPPINARTEHPWTAPAFTKTPDEDLIRLELREARGAEVQRAVANICGGAVDESARHGCALASDFDLLFVAAVGDSLETVP